MLETDYLIVGSGAVGMIFADQMLTESDARMIMVDRRAMPGGHWNDAYPFVRLHQPSAYYGVGSRALGINRIDESGLNKGYYEQASGPEITHYFDALMRERFLPSGRVQYFPMTRAHRRRPIQITALRRSDQCSLSQARRHHLLRHRGPRHPHALLSISAKA